MMMVVAADGRRRLVVDATAPQTAYFHDVMNLNETVGNKKLPQLPRVRGGMSGQEQQERMHATDRQ